MPEINTLKGGKTIENINKTKKCSFLSGYIYSRNKKKEKREE